MKKFRSLVVNLDLERSMTDATEDEDNPERSETKEEHDRCCGRYRRPDQWPRDVKEYPPWRRPQRSGRFLKPRINRRPRCANCAHHYGVVKKHMCDQNRPNSPVEIDPCESSPADHTKHRDSDDNRWQHKGHKERRPQHPFPIESIASKHRSRWKRKDYTESCGRNRLPQREPQHSSHRRV